MNKQRYDQDFLDKFPNPRPELTEQYKEIYIKEILINRGDKGGWFYRLLGQLESWMHRQVARPESEARILEIGAGTLNHLAWERSAGSYDIVEPEEKLYQNSPAKNSVGTRYSDVSEIPLSQKYGRIITIAAMEHIEELPYCAARAALALEQGGTFQIAIPSEGGFLWGASWRMTTGILFRIRNGISYAPLMRYEHINSADEIIAVTNSFFKSVKIRRFPTPFRHFSFYTYLEATDPDLQTAEAYIANTK